MGILRGIISSSTTRNVAKLLSANVVAQVIGLIVYPILTRIYAPEDFGLLNLFLSIGNILVIIATAEYQYAIVLPKEEKDAVSVLHIGVILLLLTTLFTSISICWSEEIAMLFKSPALAEYYIWLPLFVLLYGLWNLLSYWYIRQKMYMRISGYQMSQSVLLAGAKTSFGYAGFLEGGLIYSTILAPFISIVLSVTLAFKKCIIPLVHVDISRIAKMTKHYRNFPLFTLPRSVINILSAQLPILLLTPTFGAELIGLWSMALVLGFVPINMITKAFYQVLYQHTTNCVNQQQSIAKIFKRFTLWCSIIAAPLFIGLYFIIPDLSAWLLGDVWYVSGEYIRWMLPWLFCSLLTMSTNFLSDVFFKQKVGLYFEILLVTLRVIGLAIGIYYGSFVIAIAAYSIGSAIAIIAQWIWLITLVRKYENTLPITIQSND